MKAPHYVHGGVTIHHGDAVTVLNELPAQSVHCCVTSPPYWGLRSYLPDRVKLRSDLSADDLAHVAGELDRLGIRPVDDTVG